MLHIIKTELSRTIAILVLGFHLEGVFIFLQVMRFQLGIYTISGAPLYKHARSTVLIKDRLIGTWWALCQRQCGKSSSASGAPLPTRDVSRKGRHLGSIKGKSTLHLDCQWKSRSC